MNISVGIDPGINGAIAAVGVETLEVLSLVDTPAIVAGGKKLYDIAEMAAVMRHVRVLGAVVVVMLEQAQAMPGQGVASTFSTGRSFGIWEGVLSALDIPYRTVRPSIWTKKILAGLSGEGKARSIAFAMRMFPGCELTPKGCRKPRDGRADALCLAYCGVTAAQL